MPSITLDSILTQLASAKDFVWLDSADEEGVSIIAFDSCETKSFESYDDKPAFENFLKSFSTARCETKSAITNFPFNGGWMGYMSYECYAFNPLVPLKPLRNPEYPLAIFKRYDRFFVIDHKSQHIHLATENNPQDMAFFNRLSTASLSQKPTSLTKAAANQDYPIFVNDDLQRRHRYKSDFAEIKKDIEAGRYFELNYSFPLESPFSHGDLLSLYSELRSKAKAPMMSFVNFPELQILSASPERFFSIQDNVIKTTPIKGTKPRGDSAAQDDFLMQQLSSSQKDRAELLMVTDMLRNDLGRISASGSVTVENLFKVNRFPYYHHMMSEISGRLLPETNLFDVFTALFPGGSITGAPKIEVMRQIQNLEDRNRGVYTGAIGYISSCGTIDFSIAIRTLVVANKKISFAVGSGIVHDSDSESEYQECWLKASAFLNLFLFESSEIETQRIAR